MDFPQSLYDESDPAYAPFLNWDGDSPWWRASRKYRALGAKPANVRLTGTRGDGLDRERAAECRRITRDMLGKIDPARKPIPRRWDELIDRYLGDEFSPSQTGGFRRRAEKASLAKAWRKSLNEELIAAMDYDTACRIKRVLEGKYAPGLVVKKMDVLKGVLRYGIVLKAPGAREALELFAIQRTQHAAPRLRFAAADEVQAVTDEALRQGLWSLAAGVQIAWVTTLRLSDVRGQWEPVESGDGGGILHKADTGRWYRWRDGLTWDMLDADLTRIQKVIAKTARKDPRPKVFPLDVGLGEGLRTILAQMPAEKRVGPVIVREDTGLPYTPDAWTKTFKRIAKAAGCPDDLRAADIRPGAVTDGEQAGASATELAHAAGHMNVTTTAIYMRAHEKNTAKVLDLRARRRKEA